MIFIVRMPLTILCNSETFVDSNANSTLDENGIISKIVSPVFILIFSISQNKNILTFIKDFRNVNTFGFTNLTNDSKSCFGIAWIS